MEEKRKKRKILSNLSDISKSKLTRAVEGSSWEVELGVNESKFNIQRKSCKMISPVTSVVCPVNWNDVLNSYTCNTWSVNHGQQ